MTAPAQTAPNSQSDWARLFRVACSLIGQVNAAGPAIDRWTFGGGTALMLQIDHRTSRDVDIFLPDPQFLSLLNPKTRDFDYEVRPADYAGDGARYLKFSFTGIGEIDFIVGESLTSNSTTLTTIEGEATQLETIAEIITKKIFHRGANIKPRDIFDIAAASEDHSASIIRALKVYKDKVTIALTAMEKLNPEFVAAAISELAIRPRYSVVATMAIDQAKRLLLAV